MKKILSLMLAMILVLSLAACSTGNESVDKTTSGDEKVFKIGAIPDQNAAELSRGFDDFAEYLGDKVGVKIEYVPTVDYASLVTAFERGEIHMAWFGGLTGVQAMSLVEDAEAIAQRPKDEEFHSVFIAQKDLNVSSLEDLKGMNFTFGSESSTSGHLMPRHFLVEAGINPDEDFDGKPNYSGSHDKTYKLVESGAFQAGALNESVWEKAVNENTVDLNKVDVFYITPSYYDYNWTINNVDPVFGEGTKAKVKEVLLSMTKEDSKVMELLQTESFIETKNDNYEAIKKVAKSLGIIK